MRVTNNPNTNRLILRCFVFSTIFILISFVAAVVYHNKWANKPYCSKKQNATYYTTATITPSPNDKEAVLQYCKKNGLNTNYCIFVDFSISSGKPRFFIYDFKAGKNVYSCRCAHGYGGESTPKKPVFSNSPGSLCSSLGKYVTAGIGSKSFKNSIRLKGLDKTNNNAMQRGILIHSSYRVSKHIPFLRYIPLGIWSEGCLAITKEGLMKMHMLYKEERNNKFLIIAYN